MDVVKLLVMAGADSNVADDKVNISMLLKCVGCQ